MKKQHPQLSFTFIIPLHVVLLVVNKNLHRISLENIYTRKELVMMETTISYFRTSFYIPAIQMLAIHLQRVCILGTNHYGEMRRTDFKQRRLFQDVICRRD